MLETVNEEQRGYGERATCQRALTQKRNAWGGDAHLRLVCLLEDGSEREGALDSNAVVSETASEGQDGKQ